MDFKFYDVKTRQNVTVTADMVKKTKYTNSKGQTRYALRGKTSDGRNLTKFVSESDWMKADLAEE